MIPIILAGGTGSRLWPLSRGQMPKQLLKLNSDNTMFQDTVLRLKEVGADSPIVVCNDSSRFMIRENLEEKGFSSSKIILEPVGRNTAPAIAVAALSAMQYEKDPVLLVLPADHIIEDCASFRLAISEAEDLADKGYLVTFGVSPKKPHTEYGYIEFGQKIKGKSFDIKSFKEKPNVETAKEFINKGNYLWNSGMFVFKASKYLEELAKASPDTVKFAEISLKNAKKDMGFVRLEEESFAKCNNNSIDYAVMENSPMSAVVSLDAGWCDVGSWDSLWSISEKDKRGNVLKGDVVTKDSDNSYFYSDKRIIAAIGVKDLIVVDTQDAVLIAGRNKVEEVKQVVSRLKEEDRSEVDHHRVVYRPWGHYDSICQGQRDKVKRITVKPGGKLSKQMHNHRAEHWVVVKGIAKVTKGEEITFLKENESIYIPKKTIHSLENLEDSPLEIIEVQTGDYLGEDDIIRYEDLYGRA